MSKEKKLFEEFPPTTKEEWLAKAEKDLRGKPLSDLEWQLEEEISLPPFYHPDDMSTSPAPLRRPVPQNNWELGELIEVIDIPAANAALLEGLAGGVEAPLLILHRELKEEELDSLLNEVDLQAVSIHFTQFFPGKKPQELLQQFYRLVEKRKVDTGNVSGSIDFDPLLDWPDPPYKELAASITFCRDQLPRFRPLQVNGLRFHAGVEYTSRELGFLIAKGSEYLARLSEHDIPPALANQYLQFTVGLSTSYFVEIAKLRALQLLWANVLDAFGVSGEHPFIVAHLEKASQDEDMHTNMIRAGTQAMSAVIGGADRLYIRPADFTLNRPSQPFTRRIARNVQHLLRMESYLDRVIDPAAGSYYIEKLTEQLAEQSWKRFQEVEENGGFGA